MDFRAAHAEPFDGLLTDSVAVLTTLLANLVGAWTGGRSREVERLNGPSAASRETAELLDETGRMGGALGIW